MITKAAPDNHMCIGLVTMVTPLPSPDSDNDNNSGQSDIKSKAFSYLKAGPRLSLRQFLQILNVIKRADFRAKSPVLAEK